MKLDGEKLSKQILYWRESSDYDFTMAEEIFNKSGQNLGALFFLHLSIEKALKAVIVAKSADYAPLSHNLLSLVFKCGLKPNRDQEILLATINEFNLETRYPDDRNAILSKASKSYTQTMLDQGKEVRSWILKILDNTHSV